MIGQFSTCIEYDNRSVQSRIHILKGHHGSLLSYRTACDLSLIDVKTKHLHECPSMCCDLVQQYPHLFDGIGKLKNAKVKLHIDETVRPVAQSARRIPFHSRKQVEDELTSLDNKESLRKWKERLLGCYH